MTPLELLAVGMIVVLVWCSGWIARDSQARSDVAMVFVPLVLGLTAFASAIVWLLSWASRRPRNDRHRSDPGHRRTGGVDQGGISSAHAALAATEPKG